ncbi:hypothetical protein B0T17DRAFT_305690 [Bombardia bombarda]|uniref:Uncharacterized protein n=1 Tax=Bombardia bombarda TaxID=252184 RepID=A0AA40C1F1_9PEZI|nr:hypothetical protein B0T17DRAFT_305690 [Bombardia bombarda]
MFLLRKDAELPSSTVTAGTNTLTRAWYTRRPPWAVVTPCSKMVTIGMKQPVLFFINPVNMVSYDVIQRGPDANSDARFYNPSSPEHWDVDFADYGIGVAMVSNFLKYVDRHDVCPEYTEDVRKAQKLCEQALEEIPRGLLQRQERACSHVATRRLLRELQPHVPFIPSTNLHAHYRRTIFGRPVPGIRMRCQLAV